MCKGDEEIRIPADGLKFMVSHVREYGDGARNLIGRSWSIRPLIAIGLR